MTKKPLMTKQDPPYSIQIELTEGCDLRCGFCGINGIRTAKREYSYMSTKLASKIARDIYGQGWTSRIEFAMHGEPTHNPDTVGIITLLRTFIPKNYFLLVTNGGALQGKSPEVIIDKLNSYLKAGIDTIAVDEYEGIKWVGEIRKALRSGLPLPFDYHEYPEDPLGNMHQRIKRKRVVLVAPINLTPTGNHSTTDLCNHTGAGAALDYSMSNKRCTKPFREISIRWDGNVALCCDDWRGTYKIGNINDTTIGKLWQSPKFVAARQKLLHFQRDFGPCNGCNAKSYRVGLLPDGNGRMTLPLPDKKTYRIIAEALEGSAYSQVVTRPWELVNIK